MNNQQHLEEVLAFLHEHRSNENNFEKLYAKLEEECKNESNKEGHLYIQSLQEIKEKQAEAYRQMKETGGTAWPEFEKFVSAFEITVTSALKGLSTGEQS